MSRFATMTTREIQSGEGKQEGHVPGREAEKFDFK